MGEPLGISNSNRISETRAICSKKQSIGYLAASASKALSQKTLQSFALVKQHVQEIGIAGDIVVFLATTAALEIVRRFSRARCPFVWRALQALQVLCYPPFKWLQRWQPFKEVAKHTQNLSRPMLFLSIATVFSDEAEYSSETSNYGNALALPSQTSTPDTGTRSADWLQEFHSELKKQGIVLPERLGEDDLYRFYAAVNGDLRKLISAVKKTISWRQSYKLLEPHELEPWSHLLFWHGRDTSQRPCLIIRLGLACSNMQSIDRQLLVKAVVSQIEYGVLNLVTLSQPQIMVLMDFYGLSPFGFPVNMMRSCASLLQDHYPNRLGCLMIVRLPKIARVVTHTLFQVLRPATQRKVRTLGGNYLEILSQCLESLPSFLGGNCTCSKCSDMGGSSSSVQDGGGDIALTPPEAEHLNDRILDVLHNGITEDGDHHQCKRITIFSLLVLCILIFIILGTLFPGQLHFVWAQ